VNDATDPTDLLAAPAATVSGGVSPRDRLLELIKAKAVVHGRVTLSSGREADYYVDLRRITLDGEAAPLVGQVMNELTKNLDF
jgi:orotate phosphoribosyltransferase